MRRTSSASVTRTSNSKATTRIRTSRPKSRCERLMSVHIRRARPDEAGLVLALVRELAEYEKLLHEVRATEAEIDEALFGKDPRPVCDIAELNGEAAGLAAWFVNFSTFAGRHGIYLEDLFVRPTLRGNGIGKALLVNLANE